MYFGYLHKVNTVHCNFKFGANTTKRACLSPGQAFVNKRHALLINNISDGDFNEIHNLFPIASSVDSYDGVQCTLLYFF